MKRDRDGYNWDIPTAKSAYVCVDEVHVDDARSVYEDWAGRLPVDTRFQLSDAVLALYSGWCWRIYGPMWQTSALERLWPFVNKRLQLACPVVDTQSIANESAMQKIFHDHFVGSAEGPSPADAQAIVTGLLALGGKLMTGQEVA